MTITWTVDNPKLAALIAAFVCDADAPIYIVGGAVRDYLFNQASAGAIADVDILVGQNALDVARRVADQQDWAFYPLDAERGFARLVLTPERASEDGESMIDLPLVVDVTPIVGGDLRVDLSSRDFTINAMAFMIDSSIEANCASSAEFATEFSVELVDPHDGCEDLAQGVVREVTEQSLASDCLRLLRAVRFAVQFGFELEAQTKARVVALAAEIANGSAERIRDELWKALALPAPDRVIVLLREVGLLRHLLPEVETMAGVEQSLPHHLDVYNHSLLVVKYAARLRDWLLGCGMVEPPLDGAGRANRDGCVAAAEAEWIAVLAPWRSKLREHFCVPVVDKRTRARWLVWAALFHDTGKPATRTEEAQDDGSVRFRFLEHEHLSADFARDRLEGLRFGRQEIASAVRVVDAHMRPHLLDSSFWGEAVSRRACHRFFRDTGDDAGRPNGVDVLLLAIADRMAIPAGLNIAVADDECERALDEWRAYLAHIGELLAYGFADDGLAQTRQNPLVDGHVLMQRLGLQPGPALGKLLRQLAEAQAAGEVATPDDAIALAKTWLDE